MEFSDIHPVAVIAGVVGAIIGFIIIKRMTGADYNIGIIWKILIPIVCAAGGFFVVQRMAE